MIETPKDRTHALALLRQLEWRVRHAVETVLSGEYRSAFRGRGMEFDQVVRYEFGDDVRDIDWNVTARLGEPYRKKFVEEREVTLLVVFEDTPSLQFGSAGRSKREALLELAGLVMLLGAVNRDRVGYIHAKPGEHIFREPVRGRGQILHAAAKLIGHAPPDETDRRPVDVPWNFISRAAPKHSILLWLGDFSPRETPEGWPVMTRRYQPMGFRVDDPWERALPQSGPLTVFDPTSGQLVVLDPSSKAHREAHAAWALERNNGFAKLFPNVLSRLTVSTEDSMLEALVRFFHARMKQGAR